MHWAVCTNASHVLAFCPLSLTAAKWHWLPTWPSFTRFSPCSGFQMLSLLQGTGVIIFSPSEHGSTLSESGRSAAVFSIVWMTRHYSSCSINGSCTPGAIKLIHMLSPSVSKTNLQLYDSTLSALQLRMCSCLGMDFALIKAGEKLIGGRKWGKNRRRNL